MGSHKPLTPEDRAVLRRYAKDIFPGPVSSEPIVLECLIRAIPMLIDDLEDLEAVRRVNE